MRKMFAACFLLVVIASASEKVRVWQDGTVVYAERQKEAPAPSDTVAITDSGNPVRTAMNRGLEKLIGLPGQRQWAKYWIYVLDTKRLRYAAASKRAITIGEEQAVRFAIEGDHLFVLGKDGKEQKLELVKIAQVPQIEAAPQSTTRSVSTPTAEARPHSPEPTLTLRGPTEAQNEEPERNTAVPAVQNPPLPPAKVQLTINSVPDGASIELDGKPAGQTPSQVSLDPGKAFLRIEKAGFVVWAGTIMLTTGALVTLKPELKPVGYVATLPLADTKIELPHAPVLRVGSDVSAPVVLYKVDPEYSQEARDLRLSGAVVLQFVVDTTGRARDIHLLRSLAFGLDEKAIVAVSQWKFRPGYRNGQPVSVLATVEVNFRLL